MKVGDLTFKRHFNLAVSGGTSERIDLSFALGITIRPLLVRAQVILDPASTTTGAAAIFLENGSAFAAGSSLGVMVADPRLTPLGFYRHQLVTSGIQEVLQPIETWHDQLLLPDVTIHCLDTVGSGTLTGVLHYKFAELDGNEIIELAAQRAQS